MSERTTRIQFIMGPSFRAAFNVRNYGKHSELDDIREAWQEERDRKAEEALKERMRGEGSMDLHGTNIANAARKGMPARQKRGAEDSHDCYEGHSHYDPFGKRGRPVNDSSLNEEWEDAVQEIGAVFKNLFNVPPPVKKQPEPEPEQEPDPVHPTIAPIEATVETEKSPMVEDLTQPVQPEVEPKVAIFDSSVPSRPMISRSMFTTEELRKSVIMSEVLGRPVSQRRGRR